MHESLPQHCIICYGVAFFFVAGQLPDFKHFYTSQLEKVLYLGITVTKFSTRKRICSLTLVSAPDPTNVAADGLHHRYASVSFRVWRLDTGNNFVANKVGISSCSIRLQQCND